MIILNKKAMTDKYMNIETRYYYEKEWKKTNMKDLLHIIEEEIGDADPTGTLNYIQETLVNDKVITVGECKFRLYKEGRKDDE